MKEALTSSFAERVLKLGDEYVVQYSVKFLNIEIIHIETNVKRYINIHEFIHTHCRNYLMSYSNGLRIMSVTHHSDVDKRIAMLKFDIYLTVPNLLDGGGVEHEEVFSGLSELPLFISAVEWLIKYREDNPKLSKFWVNRF